LRGSKVHLFCCGSETAAIDDAQKCTHRMKKTAVESFAHNVNIICI
jgi:hypothetical protein